MNFSLLLTSLAAPSLLAAVGHAFQTQIAFDATAARAADAASPFAGPIFDQPGDGAIWVHGLTYKAKFDRRGFEYIPFLGSDAPQDYPIDFTIESARVGSSELAWQSDVEPELDGETVTFHRGAFDEVYVVRADSIEQNFVVRERRTSGDLHVVVHTESELERADGATGTAFANELGGVQVGKATIRDARGRSVASLTHLAGESIEILVPQQELETASFPLAIDPLISTWTVTLIAAPTSNFPDTSYDWWTDSWLCVNQETFSATDHDIIARQFTTGGTMLNQIYIEQTAADWTRPRVANNKSQHVFMVVAELDASTAAGSVRARTYTANSHGLGVPFTVSPGNPGHKYWCPDIGGNEFPNGTPPFCVVYLESPNDEFYGADPSLFQTNATLVSPGGQLVSHSFLAVGGASAEPIRISKSNGDAAFGGQQWTIAWLSGNSTYAYAFFTEMDSTGSNSAPDLSYAFKLGLGYNAFSVSPLIQGSGYPAFALASSESAVDANHLYVEVIWMSQYGSHGYPWEHAYATVASVQTSAVSVETDGTDVDCVYAQPIAGVHGFAQNNLYLNTFHPNLNVHGGSTLSLLQSHVLIAGSTDDESMPSLASMHSSGGGTSNMLCVYKRVATLGGAASILAATLY